MSKLVFKPGDFKCTHGCDPRIDITVCHSIQAQSKFDAWLKENGKVVYTTKVLKDHEPEHWFSKQQIDIDGPGHHGINWSTHRAYLVCIEPLEKCKHEKEKVQLKSVSMENNNYKYECQCGAHVEPTTFKEVE